MTFSDEDSYPRPKLTATMSNVPKKSEVDFRWGLTKNRFLQLGNMGDSGRGQQCDLLLLLAFATALFAIAFLALGLRLPSVPRPLRVWRLWLLPMLTAISLAAVPGGAVPTKTIVAPLRLTLTFVALSLVA